MESSLAVQWLRPCNSNAKSMSSIPGWGTKTPYAASEDHLPKTRERESRKLQTKNQFSKQENLAHANFKLKEYFGPGKENNSLKGPLMNHLTSEKTKHNFSHILMLQASCIYLGLISPCPETYHPLHPPRRLITPCPTTGVISTKEYSNPSWLMFPLSLPQTSL